MNRRKLIIVAIVLGVLFLIGLLIPKGNPETLEPTASETSRSETPITTEFESQGAEEDPINPINSYSWSSKDEYDLVIRTVITEARGESVIGQMAVAQCIRDAAEYYNITPTEVLNKLHYAKPYTMSGSSLDWQYYEIAQQAVDKVFNEGARAVYSRIMYFYAPKRIYSEFHESQVYVCTIGNHKFFDIKEDK